MPFYQQGQRVSYQVNIEGKVNFEHVADKSSFFREVHKLQEELMNLSNGSEIRSDEMDKVSKANSALVDIESEGQGKQQSKLSIINRLQSAKNHLSGLKEAVDFVAALGKAMDVAERLF